LLLLGVTVANSEYLAMPGGIYVHESCVHRYNENIALRDGKTGETEIMSSQGELLENHKECPYPIKREDLTAGKQGQSSPAPVPVGYYSDWAVYAVDAHPAGYSEMTSEWKVPAKPVSHGPAGLSSIYIFNGLEDGGGQHGNATLILQPVLQFGKSGCINDPLLWGEWHFTAYLVKGNGRAYCGSRLKVDEGDVIVGAMTLGSDKQWTVTASRPSDGATSTIKAELDVTVNAAYATVEAMILYKCSAYPAGNGTTFAKNKLVDIAGSPVTPSWSPWVRHSECNQHVAQGHNGDVTLAYDSTK